MAQRIPSRVGALNDPLLAAALEGIPAGARLAEHVAGSPGHETPMKVIYIGGYGRSGSTLLDLLLGQHPLIASGGELVHACSLAAEGALCSCGRTVEECPAWSRFRVHLTTASPPFREDWAQATRLKSHTESPAGFLHQIVPLPFIGPDTRSKEAFRDSERALDAAFDDGVAAYRVDSSKTCRTETGRAMALSAVYRDDFFFIHLVRDAYSVAASLKKGDNRKMEAGEESGGRLFMMRGLLGWCYANLVALAVRRRIGPRRSMVVRFEDLVQDPGAVLDGILQRLGLDTSDVHEFIEGHREQDDSHLLSGNRMRHEKLVVNRGAVQNPQLPMVDRVLTFFLCGWLRPFL